LDPDESSLEDPAGEYGDSSLSNNQLEAADTQQEPTEELYYEDGTPVEYDENGQPIYDEEPTYEPEPQAQTVAPTSAPEVPAFNPALAPLLDENEQQLANSLGLTPELQTLMATMIARATAQREQIATVADTYFQEAAAKAPALFQAIGPKVRQNLATLTPEYRSTPKGVHIAATMAMLAEVEQTGDFAGTLHKYGRLAAGQGAAPRKPAAPQVSNRAKVPSVSPNAGGGTGAAVRQRRPAAPRGIGVGLNLTPAEQALLAEDPLISG
jgi:hypothetical protein